MNNSFNTIEEALESLKQGKMIIVCDDENRENEGDFIMAAEKITPEAINFMATQGRGLICVPLTNERAAQLHLDYMIPNNTQLNQTPFTVSIDYGPNNTTGISAADRSNTIKAMLDEDVDPADFIRPGHIFPLVSNPFGTLKRPGHTEATIDLMNLAGLKPMGVICEIMNEDGTMARVPELKKMASKWDIKMITIADLITYRLQNEFILNQTDKIKLPTKFGEFDMRVFSPAMDPSIEIIAVSKGDIKSAENLPVRIHSQCMTGDLFGSLRCDCGEQLEAALNYIESEGSGLIIYLPQEGRNIGLTNKVKAYVLQDQGRDTVEANTLLGLDIDARDYSLAQQVLKFWDIKKIKLMTHNPDKLSQLKGLGIEISDTIFAGSVPNKHNEFYLSTKISKLGHSEKLIERAGENKQ